jgi:aminoglycoside phosphotransferase (APT) family kinase protein
MPIGVNPSDSDVESRLTAFIARRVARGTDVRIKGLTRVASGRSRENWLFDAVCTFDGRETCEPLIVRRDPLGGLLVTDRAVEFAVLSALARTAVPSPPARWLDATGKELGRPSLVMRREPGNCDYFVLNGERAVAERVALAGALCDLLATVHTVDWRGAGLGDVLVDPGPEAALHELAHWEAVLARDQLEPQPELALAACWLRDHAPRSARTVLVHGDFKAGNVLLDDDGGIVALLDWELAHLGDAMEDLGWVTQPLRTRELLIPGEWDRSHLLARYAAATGSPVDEASVSWWSVFATFKTAVMQCSGLRSFVEGRSNELHWPTEAVLRTLLDVVGA